MNPAGRRQCLARAMAKERAQATIAIAAMRRTNQRPPVCNRLRAHQSPEPVPSQCAVGTSKYHALASTGSSAKISSTENAATKAISGSHACVRQNEPANEGFICLAVHGA
jgi:hypothetical protein